jgi:hypothetical protein
MKHESLLPNSQARANCPGPELNRSSPYLHSTSERSILILSFHLGSGHPSGFLPSGYPSKTLYAPLLFRMRATCPAYLSLLDLITRMISGEQYKHKAPHHAVFSTPLLPRLS